MSQFGTKAPELRDLGVQLFGVSADTPFAHAVFAESIGIDYGLLSDYNWEAAKALGLYAANGADLAEGLADYSPSNTRGVFLVDTDGTLRYAWVAPDVGTVPDPGPLLEAARSL